MKSNEKKIKKALQTIKDNADPLFFLALVRGVCPHAIGITSHYKFVCHDNNLCDKCWDMALNEVTL